MADLFPMNHPEKLSRWPAVLSLMIVMALALLIVACEEKTQAGKTEPESVKARLAEIPKVWEREPMHRLNLDEYKSTLDYWKKKFPDHLQVERVGESIEKMGIFLLRVTDHSVSDDDKQIALITAMHGGPERSGTTTIDWLWLSGCSANLKKRKRLAKNKSWY